MTGRNPILYVRGYKGTAVPLPASFTPTLAVVTPVTGFLYDHGTHAYPAATLTGTGIQQATPGLLPQLGKDDGALRGVGTVTYPATSAISGTGDFTIAGMMVLSNISATDSAYLYHDGLALSLVADGSDRITARVANSTIFDLLRVAGVNDGRTHLYVLRRSSGTLTLTVDGTLLGTANDAFTAGNIVAGTPLTEIVNGTPTIDEVAWWRRALTDTELAALLAAANVVTASTGLLSGQWLSRHLADFAFSDASIDTGSSMIDTPDLSTGDAAIVLAEIAAAEDGMIFVDGAGNLRSVGRNEFGVSVVTFGDGVGEIPIVETPHWSMDIDRVYNRIQVTKAGYATVTADDLTSQNSYGIRPLQWSADLLAASQMTETANWLLARYKNPRLRLDTLVIRGIGYWPTVLALELGDRCTVKHHPPGGTLLTAEVLIEHIEHTIMPDDWLVTLQLAPLPPVFILDDTVQGVLDSVYVLGWGESWPRAFLLDDAVQGLVDSGYVLQ